MWTRRQVPTILGCCDPACAYASVAMTLHRDFFQTVQLRCSGDRYDPRFPSQQPGERDLGRAYLFLLRKGGDHIDQSLILLAILFAELRNSVPEIAAVELRVGIDWLP
jgi:hypothetical protein